MPMADGCRAQLHDAFSAELKLAESHAHGRKKAESLQVHRSLPPQPLPDDNKKFRPEESAQPEFDEQLFRGQGPRLPCGHSEATPKHTVHAANHR